MAYGRREVWSGLNLQLRPGEMVAVLGANGSGKTSLVRTILGQQMLTEGELDVLGRPPRRGSPYIGYVPQQSSIDNGSPVRARDLVQMGLDGHRWGVGLNRRGSRARVMQLLASVGADGYADVPVGLLSGGEQQRVRIAQAVATDPVVLLCDEPLLSLDLASQRDVVRIIDERRRTGTAVLFVTHEINPVLDLVDRVLYLGVGRHRVDIPDVVFTSESLTQLYGTPVRVVRAEGQVWITGTPGRDGHDGHPEHADRNEDAAAARRRASAARRELG